MDFHALRSDIASFMVLSIDRPDVDVDAGDAHTVFTSHAEGFAEEKLHFRPPELARNFNAFVRYVQMRTRRCGTDDDAGTSRRRRSSTAGSQGSTSRRSA